MADKDGGLFGALPDGHATEAARGGRPRLRRVERGQVELRALSLDDLLAADHRARMVWAFAERLDLAPLYEAIRSVEWSGGQGGAGPSAGRPAGADGALALCDRRGGRQRAGAGAALRRAPRLSVALRRGEREPQDAGGLPHRPWGAPGAAAGGRLGRAAYGGRSKPQPGGARHGMRVRASAGAASFRRRSTLETCRREAEAKVARLARELAADPGGPERRARAAQAHAAGRGGDRRGRTAGGRTRRARRQARHRGQGRPEGRRGEGPGRRFGGLRRSGAGPGGRSRGGSSRRRCSRSHRRGAAAQAAPDR